jgi:zinc transporter ZupT
MLASSVAKTMAALGICLPTVMILSFLGGFLPLLRELSQKALEPLLGFSAGVLLGPVFFHMFPESGKVLAGDIGLPILAGFLLIFVMERFVFVYDCEERDCGIHHMGIPPFLCTLDRNATRSLMRASASRNLPPHFRHSCSSPNTLTVSCHSQKNF